MARPRSRASNGPKSIEEALRTCVEILEQAVRAQIRAQLDEAVADALRGRRGVAPPAPSGRAKRMCPVPGCPNPAAGPKYRWRCREHKEVTTAAIEQARAKEGAGPRITKLPPGPGPGPRRAGPPMECRAAGCTKKSRGPRYEFFCAEHYNGLSKEQRAEAAAVWRARRDSGEHLTPKPPPEPKVLIRRAGQEVRAENDAAAGQTTDLPEGDAQ